MTTFQKITISGNTADVDNSSVIKSLGDTSSSSKFQAHINNYTGRNTGSYSIGDEVEIFSDITTNPPTTKIFLGILEDIDLQGKEQNERMVLSGRDYSARLMDRTVEPEVYNNLPAGSIINDIITKYTDDITTANVSSGLNVDRIVFNHVPVFDAIKQLAEFNNYMFYIDNSKDLHFKAKATTSSGYTFGSGGTPIINTSFKEKRSEVYNEVWVYGDRYLDGYQETFTGVAGSNYTLGYKPHNTIVTNSGTIPQIIQPGGIYEMTFGAGSQFKYLVNYQDKKIILTSGTDAGNNLYIGSDLIINYMRDLPIVKYGDNDASIDAYGKRIKVIQDKSIKDPITAETILLKELEEYSDPQKQGKLDIRNVGNLTPGDTCVVNIPSYNINNVTYDILEAKYDFTKRNMLADEVLSIKVNKKIPDITDTLKKILLEQKKMQSQDMQDTDLLTRYKMSAGSFGIRQSGLEVFSRPINDSFVEGHPINGVLGMVNPSTIGSLIGGVEWIAGSIGTGYDKAVKFDTPNNYILLPNNPMFELQKNYTISCWVNPSGAPASSEEIITSRTTENHFLIRRSNNQINYYDWTGGGSQKQLTSNANSLGSDTWHHIVAKRDDLNLELYIDNILQTDTETTSGSLAYSNARIHVASTTAGTANFYGKMDDLRFYNKTLSTGEIGSLYSKVNYPTDHLVAYYKFDEGVGSFAYNSASVEMPTEDAIFHAKFNSGTANFVDSTGNYIIENSNATLSDGAYNNGSSLLVNSAFEYARFYDGPSSIVSGNLLAASGNPYTVTAWINPATFGIGPSGTTSTIIGNERANKTVFQFSSDGTLLYQTDDSVLRSDGDLIQLNQWQHVAASYSLSGGSPFFPNVSLFYNGSLAKAGSYLYGSSDPYSVVGSFYIGYDNRFGEQFNGKIDEVKIYNRVLSQPEIQTLYEGKTIQPLLGDRRTGSTLEWSGGYF